MRAACCVHEETESGGGSKSLPDLPQSSLVQELLLVTPRAAGGRGERIVSHSDAIQEEMC